MPNQNDTGQAQPARSTVTQNTSQANLTSRPQQKAEELKRADWQERMQTLKSSSRMPTMAHAAAASGQSPADVIDWVLGSADKVFSFIQTVAPDIPQYGTIIGIVARIGSALIAEEPTAVALFNQIKNTITGGAPPDQATLDQWAADADAANANLEQHIHDQIAKVSARQG